jgi:hypothetical protein
LSDSGYVLQGSSLLGYLSSLSSLGLLSLLSQKVLPCCGSKKHPWKICGKSYELTPCHLGLITCPGRTRDNGGIEKSSWQLKIIPLIDSNCSSKNLLNLAYHHL